MNFTIHRALSRFARLLFATCVGLLLPVSAQSVSELTLEKSDDLLSWESVSVTPEMLSASGKIIVPNASAQQFYRMQVGVLQLPTISNPPPASTGIEEGGSVTFAIQVPGEGVSYQWYLGESGDTSQPIEGATSGTFNTGALDVDMTYWVRIGNAVGTTDSSTIRVTINRPPAIVTQPASTTIVSGETATLSVQASGPAPLNYQWYRGNLGVTTTPVGTNSATFTTPSLSATTRYWVMVGNEFGLMMSSLAMVTVVAPAPSGMALIPAGNFAMGDNLDGSSDAPVVTVNVSAFYMGKNEVTKALWDEVRIWAIANSYMDLATGAGKDVDHPVQEVSWWDVIKWCNARSQKEGLTPCYTVSGAVMKTGTAEPTVNWSANGYRLPTEAEWEKAARGGLSGKRFPWGDTISQSQANYYAYSGYSYDSSGAVNNVHPTYSIGAEPYTSPVGIFAANGYGLHDMAGNVWEWCWDWYGDSTYVNGASDPRGAASGSLRVGRGGSWGYYAIDCRVASRFNHYPSGSYSDLGFRVARSSVP